MQCNTKFHCTLDRHFVGTKLSSTRRQSGKLDIEDKNCFGENSTTLNKADTVTSETLQRFYTVRQLQLLGTSPPDDSHMIRGMFRFRCKLVAGDCRYCDWLMSNCLLCMDVTTSRDVTTHLLVCCRRSVVSLPRSIQLRVVTAVEVFDAAATSWRCDVKHFGAAH